MTSKEFIKEHIEQLEEAYESVSKLDLVEVKESVSLELEYFKKVLKDLELLEILKKYTMIQQHTHNVWFDNEFFINGKKCSEKEYEMVRGSLENES